MHLGQACFPIPTGTNKVYFTSKRPMLERVGFLFVMWSSRLLAIAVLATALAVPSSQSTFATTTQDSQPSLPMRLAFYYPWFPRNWMQNGVYPYTNYHPSLGYYSSSNVTVIKNHIAAMQYGNIVGAIASWWGQDSEEDSNFALVLAATGGTGFKWSTYYEPEGYSNPSVDQIRSDLTYLLSHYASDPSYLRINGRFVVFVYASAGDGCEMADRWKQANTVGALTVLKVFSGYRNCVSQPDSWHQYGPAVAADSQAPYAYTVSPGFWKVGEMPRLSRDLVRWQQNIRSMITSGAAFELVTTFNEWGEGTSVEGATEWETASGYGAYLDALHFNGQSKPTSLSISFSPHTVDIATSPPGMVTITVFLTPPVSGMRLLLYQSKGSASGPWNFISSDQTDGSGRCGFSWQPLETGTYFLKAEFPGSGSYLSSTTTSEPYYMTVVPEFSFFPVGWMIAVLVLSAILMRYTQHSHRRGMETWS